MCFIKDKHQEKTLFSAQVGVTGSSESLTEGKSLLAFRIEEAQGGYVIEITFREQALGLDSLNPYSWQKSR
jgi:hypothetical protein